MELERDNISKLTATQNVIKNKFKKTYSDRLVHEENVFRALKPHTPNLLRSNDINYLCTRLKKLIKSSLNGSEKCNEEIKSILSKLRDNKITI